MKKRIEFGEIRISELARHYINACLDDNWVSMGKRVNLLEEKWRKLFGYKYARALSSGTSADTACCMALYDFGAKPNDEIIIPALSFIATANSVRAAGFVPRFIDVRTDMNIDETLIEEAINDRTIAVMSVNLMGRPAQLDKIQKICKNHNLSHINDGCESYGCKFKGKFALEYADMETSSHYTAHLTCCAEGGIVSTNDQAIDQAIESIRSHGRVGGSAYFEHIRWGMNFKMSDLHAALGLAEIESFWDIFNKRRENVQFIRKYMSELEDVAYFTEEEADCVNCPHGFSITLKQKYKNRIDDFQDHLNKADIHFKRNFGSMPHHKAFDYLEIDKSQFPNAEYIGNYGLHVGCHYWLTTEDLNYLCSSIRNFLETL